MAKKNKKIVGDLLLEIKEEIHSNFTKKQKVPDIITFCEGKEWLGLPYHPTNPINLYPMQKIILKAFYRGSLGNEDIFLTKEEIERCRSLGLDNDDKGNLLAKCDNGELFRELVLVWGRRASKDFIVSIIALYEAMKLLECEGGDPYALYELACLVSFKVYCAGE